MKASDWISVKDRLPLDGDCILVAYPPQRYAEIGNVCFAIYFGDNQFYREVDGRWLKGVKQALLNNDKFVEVEI